MHRPCPGIKSPSATCRRLQPLLRVGRLLVLGVLGFATDGKAHGDAHGMIQAVSEELKRRPKDPDLYHRRGELYRRHAEWDLAWADFERAERHSTNFFMLNLSRGLLLAESNWPHSAKGYLDRFLASEPRHAAALTARGRVHVGLKDIEAAVRDFDAAIEASTDPRPELFIERAQTLVTADTARTAEALKGIEQGIQKLGGVVTLQLQAIDLELRLGQTNSALVRLDRIISQSPRKETWQARRGEILMQAGRWQESAATFNLALKQLQSLPPSRRNVPAMQELEKRIRAAMAEAESRMNPAAP